MKLEEKFHDKELPRKKFSYHLSKRNFYISSLSIQASLRFLERIQEIEIYKDKEHWKTIPIDFILLFNKTYHFMNILTIKLNLPPQHEYLFNIVLAKHLSVVPSVCYDVSPVYNFSKQDPMLYNFEQIKEPKQIHGYLLVTKYNNTEQMIPSKTIHLTLQRHPFYLELYKVWKYEIPSEIFYHDNIIKLYHIYTDDMS